MKSKWPMRIGIVLVCLLLLAACIAAVIWLAPDEEGDATPVGGTTSSTTTSTTGTTVTLPVWTGDAPDLEGKPYFTATVLEILEDGMLVQGSEDGSIAGQVILTVEKIPFAPAVGDEVKIWHTRQVMSSFPPRMIAVWVEKIG